MSRSSVHLTSWKRVSTLRQQALTWRINILAKRLLAAVRVVVLNILTASSLAQTAWSGALNRISSSPDTPFRMRT